MESPISQIDERVLYLSEYKTIVCRQCEIALRPGNGVKRHFVYAHKDWSLQTRKSIAAYASQLNLVDTDQIIPPVSVGTPVPGLTVHDGWACNECSYLCSTEQTMEKHCRSEHNWLRAKGRSWRQAFVQTFFQGVKRKFFEVEKPVGQPQLQQTSTTTGFDDLLTRLLEEGEQLERDESRQETEIGSDSQQLPVDNTPWMRKTRWARKFAGHDLRAIAALGQPPAKDEQSLVRVSESVGRIMARCRTSIAQWSDEEEDGDLVLSWLNSPQKDKFNPQPFSIHYATSTHDKYISYWKRFICYCLRLVCATDLCGYKLADHEDSALEEIWCLLELEDENNDMLDAKIQQLSVRFWMHINTASSKSAIVHFSAVLGIDGKRGCYRQPSEYGPVLAALLYCARLLLFEHALPMGPIGEVFSDIPLVTIRPTPTMTISRKDIENPLEVFLVIHNQWLIDGVPTPFHFIDNLLAYAKGAGKDVGGRSRVQWSRDRQTIILDGESLALEDFRRFLTELCDEAIQILAEDLMFFSHAREMEKIRLDGLVDNMNNSMVGYSFITDSSNSFGDGRKKMLERLMALPSSSSKWAGLIQRHPDPSRSVPNSRASRSVQMSQADLARNPHLWDQYERRLDEFRGILVVLIHICAGPPARGPELLTVRHVNVAQNMRNVFLLDGQVMIVTSYHKSQTVTGQHKVISRFLPTRIGQMVVAYLSEVVPFVRLMDRGCIPTDVKSFIWAGRKGVWDTQQITKVLTQETSIRLGIRITFQDYRHLAIAIDREHVRGLMGDISEELADNLHDLGAGHSSRTAEQIYGIDADMLRSLNPRSVNAFRDIIHRWHRFLRLKTDGERAAVAVVVAETDRKRGRTLSRQLWSLPSRKRSKRMEMGGDDEEARSDPTSILLEQGLQKLLGPGATFRSEEQREALLAIVSGEGPLVVILPTGGGKSLLFQLPASLPGAGTTVVVVPFRALATDLVRRSKMLGLSCVHWTTERPQSCAQIVLVVAETTLSDSFLHFLSVLRTSGKLDRIVIDECHMILVAGRYRPRLADLDRLRGIPCQFVLLTGTLPPCMEEGLASAMLLGSAESGLRVLRASTDRPAMAYRVDECENGQVGIRIAELIADARQKLSGTERIVVFCPSRSECEGLAAFLDCQPYHARWADKEKSMAAWMDGQNQVMVATSAIGNGVDVPGIRLVIHAGKPHGLIDFVQEVGRGGRNGEMVLSVVVIEKRAMKQLRMDGSKTEDVQKEGLRQLLISKQCRREQITKVLDRKKRQCTEGEMELCDYCILLKADKPRIVPTRPEEEEEEEEEKKWQSGPELWRGKVRERALQRATLERMRAEIGKGCSACWILDKGIQNHPETACPQLDAALSLPYGDLRRKIKYKADSCCWRCSFPGDWCLWYSRNQRCQDKDIVVGTVLAGWIHTGIRSQLEKMAQVRDEVQLIKWMERDIRIGGTNGTNAVEAAIFIGTMTLERTLDMKKTERNTSLWTM